MNRKEQNRIRNYKTSDGLARAWYHAVIAATMGNVELAIARYDREEQIQETRGCSMGYSLGEPILEVDEREEKQEIDWLTDAILTQNSTDEGRKV